MMYVSKKQLAGESMTEPNVGDHGRQRAAPPEPLAFLVGSWNRFVVLNALVPAPQTRTDLQDRTGVSRPTLSRILSALVDRGWVTRRNDEYEATRTGEVIASEVAQFVDNVETADRLDSALEWLRTERFGFPLGDLEESEVLTPTPQDQTGPLRSLAARIDATTEMRVLATGVTYEVVDAICQACLAGDLEFECVLDENALQGTRTHPELAAMFAEMVELDHCEAYYYDGDEELLAYNLIDDAVMFCGISGGGLPLGILVSEHNTVRSWAAFNFEQRKADARPLGPDAFPV